MIGADKVEAVVEVVIILQIPRVKVQLTYYPGTQTWT